MTVQELIDILETMPAYLPVKMQVKKIGIIQYNVNTVFKVADYRDNTTPTEVIITNDIS
jgi:hypothetical protein